MSLFSLHSLFALATLTVLEVILGVDNVIVLALTVSKLPEAQRERARKIGLVLALGMRLSLLATLAWVMKLSRPFFTVFGHGVSGRDLILIVGGLFLVGKSATEIFERTEDEAKAHGPERPAARSFAAAIAQIVALDMIFSLDSVITAVGMSQQLLVMSAAVVIAAVVMFFGSRAIGAFIERHPSMKVLALSFLMLVGVLLVIDGTGHHINRGYIYFAMGFAFAVELVNMYLRRRANRSETAARDGSAQAH